MATKSKRIEIFRAGRHITAAGEAIEFSEADVAAIAAAYDPAAGHAPVVVGHPKTDDPAYGWVEGLSTADGRLSADLGQVDSAFAEAVRRGAFRHVSAAFYAPGSPSNPKPGTYYLRHVGFLGAQPPAVKGLAPVEFSAPAADVEIQIEFSEAAEAARGEGGAPHAPESDVLALDRTASAPSPSAAIGSAADPGRAPASDPLSTPAPQCAAAPAEAPAESADRSAQEAAGADAAGESIAAKLAAIVARETALRRREAELEAAERAAKRADATAFAERLIQRGKLLPRDQAGIVEVLMAVSTIAPIEFSEGGAQRQVTPAQWLREFLARDLPGVEFAELAGGPAPEVDEAAAIARLEARIPEIIAAHKARGEIITHRRAAHLAAQEMP